MDSVLCINTNHITKYLLESLVDETKTIFKYKKMKNLTSPIQATPINRTSGAVRQANGVSASILGCHNIGPIKVCVPFADKNSK